MEKELINKLKRVYTRKYKTYSEYCQKAEEVLGERHTIHPEEIKRFSKFIKEHYDRDLDEYFCELYYSLREFKTRLFDMDSIITEIACWFFLGHRPRNAIKTRFLKPDGKADGVEIYFQAMG